MASQDIPLFLTVPEAAEVLRIGRTKAYQQANRWMATDGKEGIPACKIGDQTRVPTGLLEERFGIRITARPVRRNAKQNEATEAVRTLDVARGDGAKRGRARARRPAQGGLPFAGQV